MINNTNNSTIYKQYIPTLSLEDFTEFSRTILSNDYKKSEHLEYLEYLRTYDNVELLEKVINLKMELYVRACIARVLWFKNGFNKKYSKVLKEYFESLKPSNLSLLYIDFIESKNDKYIPLNLKINEIELTETEIQDMLMDVYFKKVKKGLSKNSEKWKNQEITSNIILLNQYTPFSEEAEREKLGNSTERSDAFLLSQYSGILSSYLSRLNDFSIKEQIFISAHYPLDVLLDSKGFSKYKNSLLLNITKWQNKAISYVPFLATPHFLILRFITEGFITDGLLFFSQLIQLDPILSRNELNIL